ncbi:DNA/RNA non-specific endonuclease [Streptomyces sp. NPDC002688]|uniref:DNA/RNA non-specific endonuclease n=1 Tax=Streptomyces sp. NPDC002688 TaxID=3154423 RepID=UPI00332C29A0
MDDAVQATVDTTQMRGLVDEGIYLPESTVDLDGATAADADSAGAGGGTPVEGPARDRSNRCDTGVGFNSKGNIAYLPRREQAGECVATGAFASLTQADYTPPPRKKLGFALPGFRDLPSNRARGHLIGFAMGGSNSDTRNFVPMYQEANQSMWDHAEDPVVESIKSGGHQFIEVIPVYGNPTSAIPSKIKFNSFGDVDVHCEFDNNAMGTYKCQ